jgi:hypothetical protein
LLVLVWFVVVVSNQINLTFEVFMSSTFIRSAMTAVALSIFSATFPSLVSMPVAHQQIVCYASVSIAIVMLWFDNRKTNASQNKEAKKAAIKATGVKPSSNRSVHRGKSRSAKAKRRKRKA